MNQTENPWLKIPAVDYEGHMSAPHVGQLKFLADTFNKTLERVNPKSILVLGCTTGNGFEPLENIDLAKVVGVDINSEYVSICRDRYQSRIPSLQVICDDVENLELSDDEFDLINAALFFEYVDVDSVLSKVSRWLKQSGILSVVLQLHGDGIKTVSETNYESILSLVPFIKLVDENNFISVAEENKLVLVEESTVELESGKRFKIIYFQKNNFIGIGCEK